MTTLVGHVGGHRFTESKKALQIQVVGSESDDGEIADVGFSDPFGPWFAIGVPINREVDGDGNVKGSCEVLTVNDGDERRVIGMRDVRISQYAQDLKPGEFALVNGSGFRLMVGHTVVSLNAGGGFLNFDLVQKKVALVGIPATPGGPAPYFVMDVTKIGFVSATGGASVTASTDKVTVSGAAIALNAGRVNLGVGASDPVVTYSQLMAVVAALLAQYNAHMHVANNVIPTVPLVLVPVPGRHVFAPVGG